MRDPKFTPEQLQKAADEWGCNCGPAALAVALDVGLEEARDLIPLFKQKGFTSPQMMEVALKNSAKRWYQTGLNWPSWGLAFVQWKGPWTEDPKIPFAARYKYTHWVACEAASNSNAQVFDVNCGWCSNRAWAKNIVPAITGRIARATGGWYIAKAYEVVQ